MARPRRRIAGRVAWEATFTVGSEDLAGFAPLAHDRVGRLLWKTLRA